MNTRAAHVGPGTGVAKPGRYPAPLRRKFKVLNKLNEQGVAAARQGFGFVVAVTVAACALLLLLMRFGFADPALELLWVALSLVALLVVHCTVHAVEDALNVSAKPLSYHEHD